MIASLKWTNPDSYSSEQQNINFLVKILMSENKHSLTTKKLVILAYAVGEELLSASSIKGHFHMLVTKLNKTCYYMKQDKCTCGELFSIMISDLYHECRCTSVKEYFTQIFDCSCMKTFPCETVYEILLHSSVIDSLTRSERGFLYRLQHFHCEHFYSFSRLELLPTFINTICYVMYFPAIISSIIWFGSDFWYCQCITCLISYSISTLIHMKLLVFGLLQHSTNERMEWMIVDVPVLFMNFIRFSLCF